MVLRPDKEVEAARSEAHDALPNPSPSAISCLVPSVTEQRQNDDQAVKELDVEARQANAQHAGLDEGHGQRADGATNARRCGRSRRAAARRLVLRDRKGLRGPALLPRPSTRRNRPRSGCRARRRWRKQVSEAERLMRNRLHVEGFLAQFHCRAAIGRCNWVRSRQIAYARARQKVPVM